MKITAISEFPVPETRHGLRRFLGMAGYYQCFCQNISSVAVPLTALLSPLKVIEWSPKCKTAFDSIKMLLCSEMEMGAGAVLLQEDKDGIKHPIYYFSKKFNKS